MAVDPALVSTSRVVEISSEFIAGLQRYILLKNLLKQRDFLLNLHQLTMLDSISKRRIAAYPHTLLF
jgi:hypothetical protein